MLDAETWKIVFEVYKEYPIPALTLAQQLTAIIQSLESGRKGIPDAIEALNLAIDCLFEHTDFNHVIRTLYRQRLDGNLKFKLEEKLRELGVLIETLIANGSLTREQAQTLLRHSDLKTAFAIWDELQGEMPDNELRRMEEQATRFLENLRREISERSK